jgi:hypothetical protein
LTPSSLANLEYERLVVGGVARISARTKPEKAAEGLTQQRRR